MGVVGDKRLGDKMSTMIFLGAGASAADGAPMQGAVFRDYARRVRNGEFVEMGTTPWYHIAAIPGFLKMFFGVDLHRDDPDSAAFPTFEEALGILDLARARKEGFGIRSYRVGTRPTNQPTVDQMRFILIEMLTLVIGSANTGVLPRVHLSLCEKLSSLKLLEAVTFVTTNYDTFLDTALTQVLGGASPEYGFTIEPFASPTASSNRPMILKVHGSLDWLYCPSCLSVRRSTQDTFFIHPCDQCGDFEEPLIVPPTFFKEMDNVVLASVWRQFQRRLHDTEHLIFCGYSFPDADLHIKYALKHREVVAPRTPLRVTILNNHPDKSDQAREDERLRFARFFRDDVRYTTLGFEDFARDPSAIFGFASGTVP
jgi:NAD-dependent SIR2 family protein deacetylase